MTVYIRFNEMAQLAAMCKSIMIAIKREHNIIFFFFFFFTLSSTIDRHITTTIEHHLLLTRIG